MLRWSRSHQHQHQLLPSHHHPQSASASYRTTAPTTHTRARRVPTSPTATTPTPTTSRLKWPPRGTTSNPSPRPLSSSGLCRWVSDGPGHHHTTTATTSPSTHMRGILVSLGPSRITFLATTSISHTRTHTTHQITFSNNSPSTLGSTTTSRLASAPSATIQATAYR